MGFDTAEISFAANLQDVDEWLLRGLNRHIVIVSPELLVVWEGFVNEMEVTIGGLTISRGPLMDVSNRVSVVYSRIFEDAAPAPSGGKWQTIIVEDSASQSKWGVFEEVYSIGEATLDSAVDTSLGDPAIREN